MVFPELQEAIARVLDAAESSFDTRDLEQPLLELCRLLRQLSWRRHESIEALLALTSPGPDSVELALPGVVEILEFCMRELRWPEVRTAMRAIDSPGHDWRARRAAQRVLEVYEDEWPGGEIYETFREEH